MGPARILIVEDEGIIAMTLELTLEQLGHDTIGIVGSGEDAIVYSERYRPDLVLMDIRLIGKMDGIEAALRIKELYGISSLFMTGNTDESTKQKALDIKPLGYLEKPVDRRMLDSAVQVALKKIR